MNLEEMLTEIDRREYYDRKEREHIELMECWWDAVMFGVKISVIVVCLLSIAGHVRELWQALAACF